MSRITLPAFVLVACVALMLASVLWARGELPPQVSSHFNAVGQPDDSMSRDGYLALMAAVGVGMPLFLSAIFYGVRFFPTSIVNMPNREYWLAPERRLETSQKMLGYGLWFACAESLFLTLIHVHVVQANLAQPVRLTNLVWIELGGFLAFVVAWLVLLYRAFRLPAQ
jgi:serine/threonine-protein kinase